MREQKRLGFPWREVRDVIRKTYKRPNKKENGPKSFPKDYLWTLGKGVLY